MSLFEEIQEIICEPRTNFCGKRGYQDLWVKAMIAVAFVLSTLSKIGAG